MDAIQVSVGVVVAALSLAFARAPAQAQSFDRVLRQLTSDSATIRIDAFRQLKAVGAANHVAVCSPRASGEVAGALIAALEKEDNIVYGGGPGSLSEDEVDDYFGNLVGCVAALHDPRALTGLLGALASGGGAAGGLIALGDVAVPALIQKSQQSKDGSAGYAAFTAVVALASRHDSLHLSQASVVAIRDALVKMLSHKDGRVREEAVRGIESYSDQVVHDAIARLVATDPYVVGRGGQAVYPVRNAATKWLKLDSLRASGSRRP